MSLYSLYFTGRVEYEKINLGYFVVDVCLGMWG